MKRERGYKTERVWVLLGGLLLPVGCRQPVPEPVAVKVDGVRNLSEAGNIYIAGAVTADGLKTLKSRGVTTMIDLRLEKQTSPDDAAAAKAVGVERIHLPMDSTGMTDAQAKAFLDVMRKHEGERVLIHCGSANRAGAMYGLYLGARGACSVEDAIRRARAAGMRSEDLAKDVRTYLEAHR